jgi:Tfp pilus assembly protein PilV
MSMSVQSRRSERGYALIEAMVGGAVLMVALGSVFSGMLAAREHVARSLVDQHMTQHLVYEAERVRSAALNKEPWATVGNNKACFLKPATLPEGPPELPEGVRCHIDVTSVTDTAVGGAAGPLTYKRAVITLTFAKLSHSERERTQSVTVIK